MTMEAVNVHAPLEAPEATQSHGIIADDANDTDAELPSVKSVVRATRSGNAKVEQTIEWEGHRVTFHAHMYRDKEPWLYLRVDDGDWLQRLPGGRTMEPRTDR